MQALFQEKLQVLNVGLSSFAESVARAGGTALQIEWAPPAQGHQTVCRELAQLVNLPAVEAANQQAFDAYLSAQPVLRGIGIAGKVLPNMAERMILHGGSADRLGAHVRSRCRAPSSARSSMKAGRRMPLARGPWLPVARSSSNPVTIMPPSVRWLASSARPCRCGSLSMPPHGNQAFSNFNEGIGRVLRFGANSPEVIDRLKWIGQGARTDACRPDWRLLADLISNR